MGWIVTSDQSGRDRLLEVTRTALAELQTAVVEPTSTSWPFRESDVDLPEPHAEIAGDTSTQSFACGTDRRTHPSLSSSHGSCSRWSSTHKPELRCALPNHPRPEAIRHPTPASATTSGNSRPRSRSAATPSASGNALGSRSAETRHVDPLTPAPVLLRGRQRHQVGGVRFCFDQSEARCRARARWPGRLRSGRVPR